jgi:1-deoxy-D-xylulose-5-phosphate reductoisomerase
MKLTILGSTGSIGESTLRVVQYMNSLTPGFFEIDTLIAGTNAKALARQARAVNAKNAVICDETQFNSLTEELSGSCTQPAAGLNAVLDAAAQPVDKCMAAISGTAGLLPTLAAIDAGNTILLANKETMVCAGPMVLERAKKNDVRIIPVDSEHNAIFQVMQGDCDLDRITLTASGGPFRTSTLTEMRQATPEKALAHPNWSMGAKNSLDSATMMNKGLELIEAAYLFNVPEERIDVLIHQQSIIHSMVSFTDGSVLAQMGEPDMRTPIAHALAWPHRIKTEVKRLDLAALARLDFETPDDERFPALNLARVASRAGALGTSVFNAANEFAGLAFLNGNCGFLDISDLVRYALDKALDKDDTEMPVSVDSIDDVLAVTKSVERWINSRVAS